MKSTNVASEEIDFHDFKPASTDGKKWLEDVNKIKEELEMTGQQVLVRIGRYIVTK